MSATPPPILDYRSAPPAAQLASQPKSRLYRFALSMAVFALLIATPFLGLLTIVAAVMIFLHDADPKSTNSTRDLVLARSVYAAAAVVGAITFRYAVQALLKLARLTSKHASPPLRDD